MVARNAEYQQRRDMILRTVRAIGMEADTPKASLYVWALPPKGYGSIEFADKVLLETGVSFTPGDAYGPSGQGYIRISMGTETKKIAEAMARAYAYIVDKEISRTSRNKAKGKDDPHKTSDYICTLFPLLLFYTPYLSGDFP